MLSATMLGIFFVPLFYYLIGTWLDRRAAKKPGQGDDHAMQKEGV